MSILETAAQMFNSKVGKDLDISTVMSELKNILPTQNGEIDLEGILQIFTEKGDVLASALNSFLGSGDNAKISVDDVLSIFGENKIAQFASSLGLDTESAANGLSSMIPDLLDKSSDGGALVKNIASNVFGKLF